MRADRLRRPLNFTLDAMRTTTKAGLLYIAPAIALAAIWHVMLFTSVPSNRTAGQAAVETLTFVLTEGPRPEWFAWLLALMPICLAMTLAYLSPLPRHRAGSIALLAVGTCLSVAAWLTITSSIALFMTLPMWYGLIAVKESASASSINGA